MNSNLSIGLDIVTISKTSWTNGNTSSQNLKFYSCRRNTAHFFTTSATQTTKTEISRRRRIKQRRSKHHGHHTLQTSIKCSPETRWCTYKKTRTYRGRTNTITQKGQRASFPVHHKTVHHKNIKRPKPEERAHTRAKTAQIDSKLC